MLINTFVLCNERDDSEELGIPDKGIWLPMVLDMSMIIALKIASPDPEDDVYNKTILYGLDGGVYTVDMEYEEAAELFHQSREKLHGTTNTDANQGRDR